ncbi:MAG: dCTP deaminase [Gallionella sp.]|nr:dCTP deaminase [Gallionella sp.]
MVFSDLGIRRLIEQGLLKVVPFADSSIRPASICLHLSDDLLIFEGAKTVVDLDDSATFPNSRRISMSTTGNYELLPNQFLLGATKESIALSKQLVGHVSNISGLARLGISVALSTHIAPGFGESLSRPLTLEIYNASSSIIRLRPSIRICHLLISPVEPTASVGYDDMFPKKYINPSPGSSEYSD